MAIRPEISLQAGKIPQDTGIVGGIERGMKLQQLAMQPAILEQQLATARQAELASRAATAISQAQLPGVTAESTKKTREMVDFPAWLQQNGGKFIDPKTNTIDTNRLVEGALGAGFGQEALTYSGSELSRVKQQIDNATSEQDRQAKLMKYKDDSIQTIGNFLHAAPPENRLALLNQLTESLDKQFPDARIGTGIRNMFIDEDRNKGITKVNEGVIKAARTAGMTPAEQEANAREWAKLNPEFAATQQNVVPVEARIAAVRDAEIGDQIIRGNTDAITAIPDLAKQLKLSTRPGAITMDLWNKYVAQSPEAARINAQINAYNARNPGQPLVITDGLDAVQARLQQENLILEPRNRANRAIGERGTVVPIGQQTQNTKEKPQAQGAQAPLPKPQIPTVKSVEEARALPPGTRFMTPDGRIKVR
jgi:hypothetical protein